MRRGVMAVFVLACLGASGASFAQTKVCEHDMATACTGAPGQETCPVTQTCSSTIFNLRFCPANGQFCSGQTCQPFGCVETGGNNGGGPQPTPPPAPLQCSDGLDNDGDGFIDFPDDPGCVSASDNNESDPNPPRPACSDGRDNDGDGLVDYPDDPDCGSYNDDSEDSEYRCTSNCFCVANEGGDVAQETDFLSCSVSGQHSLCPANQATCQLRSYSRINRTTGEAETVTGYECPLGADRRCINQSGTWRCSGNTCVDPNNVPRDNVNPETPFPENTGQITSDGNCVGTIRMFGGSGKRCRRRGTQTAWQNCCNNNMPLLQDTSGKPGEQDQRSYREEKSSFEFFSNQCDIEDQETALLAESGYCISLGTYCAERWSFIGCVQRAQGYCCFNSKLARIIQEQGKPQLPAKGGFGSASNPSCEGFTPEEFQALDFSKIDMSEYEQDIQTQAESVMGERMRDAARNYGN